MPTTPEPTVAVVLPPREGFGPGRTGAVGLIARRLARVPGFSTIFVGGPQAGPAFPDAAFSIARPPIWLPGNINTRYAAGVARLLRRMRPALIEVHNRTEVALYLARRFATPVSLFLHNDPQSMRRARTASDRAALLQQLSGVVCVSDYLRSRFMQGVGALGHKVTVLPNCIDVAAIHPARQRAPEILFAGRVVAEKGADAFVAACALALPQLPGWQATLIGADRFRDASPDTDFVRAVRRAAEAASVTLTGYRDHPDVLAAMARAAIVVVPSRWQEPFGLVALEAMASGAALICSSHGGLPEVAGDAALYAEPDEVAGLAAAIVALARDPERRAALAAAGRARAEAFDVGRAARRLADLRRAILTAGG